MKQTQPTPQNRIAHFDYLRILATFGVIVIHVSAASWYSISPRTWQWQTLSIYNNLFRWAVPVFFLMSGALCLHNTYTLRNILTRKIPHFLIAYIIWSSFYSLLTFFKGDYSIWGAIDALLSGHYHLWFLPAIIPLYLLIPLLKPIADTKQTIQYVLMITFGLSYVLPEAVHLLGFIPFLPLQKLLPQLETLVANPLPEYVFYFLCGYYLQKEEFSDKQQKAIYGIGLVGFLWTIVASGLISYRMDAPYTRYSTYTSLSVSTTSIALFLFAKYHFPPMPLSPRMASLVKTLSAYSFGIYLVHPLFVDTFDYYLHWNSLSFSPVVSVPVISLVVAVLSFLISALIHRIPVAKKYIV